MMAVFVPARCLGINIRPTSTSQRHKPLPSKTMTSNTTTGPSDARCARCNKQLHDHPNRPIRSCRRCGSVFYCNRRHEQSNHQRHLPNSLANAPPENARPATAPPALAPPSNNPPQNAPPPPSNNSGLPPKVPLGFLVSLGFGMMFLSHGEGGGVQNGVQDEDEDVDEQDEE